MDVIRLLFLALAQILFSSAGESLFPSVIFNDHDSSIECNEIEKVTGGNQNRRVGRTYESRLIFGIMLTWYTFSNIYYYGDDPLTFWEWGLCLLMISSAAFRFWCYWVIGNLSTFKSGIELIETGPYKYLIHPSYTSQVTFMLSYLLFHAVHIILLTPLVCYVIYQLVHRMNDEQYTMGMKNKFNDKYKEYISARWRLIPFVY